MPVPFVNEVFPAEGAEGSDGGRRTPPLGGGTTPPLDANAPAFKPGQGAWAGASDTFSNLTYDAAPFFPNEMQSRMAAAKAKKAIEAAAQEHPGWGAVSSQIDDPRRAKMDRKARPAVSAGMEKQRALVAACVKARSRPLTHTAPPQNLAEMHRRIIEGQSATDKKDDLTPRFPPANVFAPPPGLELPSSGPAAVASDLPRILGRSAQALNISPKAEDALGLDLKFLDEDEETPADTGLGPELSAAPFLGFAIPESPAVVPPAMPPTMPPMPRFGASAFPKA